MIKHPYWSIYVCSVCWYASQNIKLSRKNSYASGQEKKNVLKVLKSVIAKPLQTQEEICKDVWLWEGTVNRALREVEKIGGEIKMIDFIKSDLEVQKKIQDEIQKKT